MLKQLAEEQMSYIRKSLTNVVVSISAVMLIAAIAIWQFYQFVMFTNANGIRVAQGGESHLWWAIGLGLVACIASFFVFSYFLRYDKDSEMHITS